MNSYFSLYVHYLLRTYNVPGTVPSTRMPGLLTRQTRSLPSGNLQSSDRDKDKANNHTNNYNSSEGKYRMLPKGAFRKDGSEEMTCKPRIKIRVNKIKARKKNTF